GEVCQLFSAQFQGKGIDLRRPLKEKPLLVWGDYEMATQILNNLVSNALKFTDSGFVQIDVLLEDKKLKVRVRDTGPGIPMSEQDKLYGKFFRSSSTAKKI